VFCFFITAGVPPELNGSEEPCILHAYISLLPSQLAYQQVKKFQHRQRYLEFIVELAQKGLAEGFPEAVLEWCYDANDRLLRYGK